MAGDYDDLDGSDPDRLEEEVIRLPVGLAAYLDAGLALEDAIPNRLEFFAEELVDAEIDRPDHRRDHDAMYREAKAQEASEYAALSPQHWEEATYRQWVAECTEDAALRLRALAALPPEIAQRHLHTADLAARPFAASVEPVSPSESASTGCMTCGAVLDEGELVARIADRTDYLEPVLVCAACVDYLHRRLVLPE